MNRESDIMVAYPPWKLEYLEKKRKREAKLPVNEVPQWKRELLKRIQSKNLRMIEEQQQVDILEEHIPKVSDNIFVTHEKKPQRLTSAPTIRSISNEALIPATPTYTIAVDNIIIIEKDDKDSTKEVDEKAPSIDDKKEYPKAGIVHRLMGRFQTGESDTQAKKSPVGFTSHQKIERQLETSENYRLSQEESPTPTADQVSSVKELSTTESVFSIEESEPQSESAMQSDMLSPLLISSAKPFSRQRSDNTDRFHHVNKPIRKVSAPVSAKSLVPKSEPKAALPADIIPCPPQFADDLSHLHANAQEHESNVPTKTIVIQKEMLPRIEPPIPKRVSLKNGETLHSNGMESSKKREVRLQGSTKPPVPTKRFDPYASLHDKSNIYSRQRQPKMETKETDKAKSVLYPKTAASTHTLQSEVTVKEPPNPIDHKSNAQTALKENRIHASSATRRRDNLENEFKKVVYEPLDETTLKSSSAARAANRLMQNSTTFKITPSKQAQRTVASPPLKTDTTSKIDSVALNNSQECYNATTKSSSPSLTSVKPPTIPLRRHEIETPSVHETATAPSSVEKTEPKTVVDTPTHVVKSTDTTVSTSIFNNPPEPKVDVDKSKPTGNSANNIVNSSVFKKPEAVVKAPRPTIKSIDNTVNSSVYKPPVSTVPKQIEVSSAISQPVKSHQVLSQPKTLPTVSSAAKSPTVQSESKPSIFGPRITKSSSSSNRGKSFTIDPSKFKRSSAQPPAALATSGSYQESSSTRTIVPGAKSQITSDLEFGGDQPKSGKRKLTVDQITVIGGYVTLEKSCLIKGTKRKKSVTLSFSEKDLETTYSYVSERSLLEEDQPSVEFKNVSKSPGFGKDSTIGKYTPKYLLSMKSSEILDNEDDTHESKLVKDSSVDSPSTSSHATPLSDDNALVWSDSTSGSTDILF